MDYNMNTDINIEKIKRMLINIEDDVIMTGKDFTYLDLPKLYEKTLALKQLIEATLWGTDGYDTNN